MRTPQPIELNGHPIAGGKLPLICVPLVGRTPNAITAELAVILPKKPDVLEWRVDFFEDIGNTAAVIAMARAIKGMAAGVPLLFTRRASVEGGEPIALTETQVIALYAAVCASKAVNLIDYELVHGAACIAHVQSAAKASGIALVLSFHNFSYTPPSDLLITKFQEAAQLGADVAKVAVMPHCMDDVLTLLAATQTASRQLPIALISMSMGSMGVMSRLFGWSFGSALTFAVGATSSAPGQLAIEDLRQTLAVLQKPANA